MMFIFGMTVFFLGLFACAFVLGGYAGIRITSRKILDKIICDDELFSNLLQCRKAYLEAVKKEAETSLSDFPKTKD